ncbi:MAG: LrgB family protein [Synergistaceae bacterium]
MESLFVNSLFFGTFLTAFCYVVSMSISKRLNSPFFNTLLFSVFLVILILKVANIKYETFMSGAQYVSYLLTPATICLAVPLYEKRALVKKYFFAIFTGIFVAVSANVFAIYIFSLIFSFTHLQYATFLPKSITTAIGISLAEEIGGTPNLTVVAICITGITGHIIAEPLCKFLKINEPVAIGVAIGASSHALGTTKAIELGETEGAMSGLAIVLTGILTVAILPLVSNLI